MRRLLTMFVLGVSLVLLLPATPAGAVGGIEMASAVNGTKLDHRVRLDPDRPARVELTVANNTDNPLRVRSVRLSGSVLGLTFFSSSTANRLEVPARQTRMWAVEVEVEDLGSQATGLLPLEVTLVGEKRRTLATAGATADVRGSVDSTYGLFGLGLLVVTFLLWASALLAMVRGSLPANRWRRAVAFAPGGVGLGLVAVVTLSVLRVVAPSAPSELGFVAGAAAVSFLLGYLTPAPPRRARVPAGSPSPAGPSNPSGPAGWPAPPGVGHPGASGLGRPGAFADGLEEVTERRAPRHAP
jgi:hypothetical protein